MLQMEVGFDVPSLDAKVTYNKTFTKKDVFGIEGEFLKKIENLILGLDVKCTSAQTIADSKTPSDLNVLTNGISYKRKVGLGEIVITGTIIGDKAVTLQILLKQGPIAFGGEMRVDLSDPSKFLDNVKFLDHFLHFVAKIGQKVHKNTYGDIQLLTFSKNPFLSTGLKDTP